MVKPELPAPLIHIDGLNNHITADFIQHLPPESPIVPNVLYEVRISKHTFYCRLHSISKYGSRSPVHTAGETLYNMFVYIDPDKELEGYLTLILRDGDFCNIGRRPVRVQQVPDDAVNGLVLSYSNRTR